MQLTQFKDRILITGGAGFIGSHLCRHFVHKYPENLILNLDALTYAGNLENVNDLQSASNYVFIKEDIRNREAIFDIFDQHQITKVIHLAAESHVDRSIDNASEFLTTNILGTSNLLDASLKQMDSSNGFKLFHHVSTDEVFGALGEDGAFDETTPYNPNSPYSASKASSDHLVRAWHNTYKLPFVITNCSNNYGPNQFPEKLIPVVINKLINKEPIPVYGKGLNVRDWLFVKDHIDAIDLIFNSDSSVHNQTYCIGGGIEISNIKLVEKICDIFDEIKNEKIGFSHQYISFVEDRKGHDYRYAIDYNKLKSKLGWNPKFEFETALRETILFYMN